MKTNEIINKIEHDSVYSNLVYPLTKNYIIVCKVDDTWLRFKLARTFNINPLDARIQSRYAIIMDGFIYYNEDGNHWLIEKVTIIEDLTKKEIEEKLASIYDNNLLAHVANPTTPIANRIVVRTSKGDLYLDAILSEALNNLKNTTTMVICNAIFDIIYENFDIMGRNTLKGLTDVTRYIPELLNYKPKSKNLGESWFDRSNKDIRIQILNHMLLRIKLGEF